MTCIDDSNMVPQEEEDIDDVRWMTYEETALALIDSYGSIKDVFRKFEKQLKMIQE
jgi:NADH pyrophosphatase NudC (nudix superfamily)